MARHLGGVPPNDRERDLSTNDRARDLAQWAASADTPKKKRLAGTSDRALLRHLDEVNAILGRQAWAEFRPEHFVALYADLFFRVYGVKDESLTSKERAVARAVAGRMLDQDFGGDRAEM